MTVFGRTFDGQEIATLIGLLLALGMWIAVWLGNRRDSQWFKTWNDQRKARREAELASGKGDNPAPDSDRDGPRGPWS